MDLQPTQITRNGDDQLLIQWSDGQRRVYSLRELRDSCPCATCREKRGRAGAPLPNPQAG